MTRFMATTAIATALLAGPALSEGHGAGMFRAEADTQNVHASDFIGMRVYVSEAEMTGEVDGFQEGWDDVGEVNDIILSRDGTIDSVLIDLGGFLGVGERQVAFDMGTINFVPDATTEDADDFFLVIPASRAMLEDAPEYPYDTSLTGPGALTVDESAADAMEETEMAAEEVTDDANAVIEETIANVDDTTEEAMERDGYTVTAVQDLTTEDLMGAPVYDQNDVWIGEISSLILSDASELHSAIIDVGGFLGIGEKPVEVSMESLQILGQENTDEVLVLLSLTQEELEAMPTYEG